MKISLLNIADINLQSQDIQSIEPDRTLKKYSPFREDNPSFPKSLARSGRHSGEVNGPAPTNSRGRRRPPRKASMIPSFSCSISRLGNSSELDCTRLNEMVRAAAFRLAPDKKMRRAPIFLSGPECRGALWRRAACVQNRPRYSTS